MAESKSPVVPPLPAGKTWEDEFFEEHGVKDDEEKDAIRSRARVLEYARRKQTEDEKKAHPEPEKKNKKKWYDKT